MPFFIKGNNNITKKGNNNITKKRNFTFPNKNLISLVNAWKVGSFLHFDLSFFNTSFNILLVDFLPTYWNENKECGGKLKEC